MKDAFHRYVVNGEKDAISPEDKGTKVAAHYECHIPAGESVSFSSSVLSFFSSKAVDLFSYPLFSSSGHQWLKNDPLL